MSTCVLLCLLVVLPWIAACWLIDGMLGMLSPAVAAAVVAIILMTLLTMMSSDMFAAAFFGVVALIMLAWGVAMWAGAPEADRCPAPSLREIVAETVGAFRDVPEAAWKRPEVGR